MEAAQPCKGAKRSEAPVQKCKGERQRFGWQVAGNVFGSQVSAVGYQVRVIRFGYGCGT